MILVTMRPRFAVLAVLLIMAVTGPAACGDDSSTTRTQGPRTNPNAALKLPSPPGRGKRRGHSADEFKGIFANAKEICGNSTRENVARTAGSRSIRPRAIALAVSRGYKPKLRKQAYTGCLAGLR